MYQTNCSTCGGKLYLTEAHITFRPGDVEVDPVIGTCFDPGDIYDYVKEIVTCGDCGHTCDLSEIYLGDSETVGLTQPDGDYYTPEQAREINRWEMWGK
jgi:hypothetical protein